MSMLVLEWSRFIRGALKDEMPGSEQGTAVTIGVFDGIHRGHRALIERIVSRSLWGVAPKIEDFCELSQKYSMQTPNRLAAGASNCVKSGISLYDVREVPQVPRSLWGVAPKTEGFCELSQKCSMQTPNRLAAGASNYVKSGISSYDLCKVPQASGRPPLIPMVVTFRQSPKAALKKPGWTGDLLSLNRKLAFFENLGVEAVILIDFSLNFSKITGKEFIDLLVRWGKPLFIVVGAGFRCGYQMDTDAARIKALVKGAGVSIEVADPVLEGLHPVSSSRIRAAIAEGDLVRAAHLLGRNVEIDVSGMTVSFRPGGLFYHTVSQNRITPAPGRYSAVLHGGDAGSGIKTDVSVEKEGVFVPLSVNAEWIEFLKADH